MALVQTITVDPSKVPTDQGSGVGSAGIPLFYDLSNAGSAFWDTVANGGGDIRVFENDGVTELPREVVSCLGTYQAFDGVDDVSTLGSGLSPAASTDWEMELVVRHNSGTSNSQVIGSSSANSSVATDNNRVLVSTGNVFSTFSYATDVLDNTNFHTIRIVNDETSGELRCFVDGVEGTSGALTNRDIDSFNVIGVRNGSYGDNDIASIKVWSDVTRTNLVHDYNARNISGTTWTDAGSAGNDGTLSGSMAAPTVVNTGELHFLADHVDSVSDTVFQIHADGVSSDYASDATYGSEAVWVDYGAVYHLSDDPSGGTFTDSAGNADLTISGGMVAGDSVTGQMGSAVQFDGTEYADSATSFSFGFPLTVQAWAAPDSGSPDQWVGGVFRNNTAFDRVAIGSQSFNVKGLTRGATTLQAGTVTASTWSHISYVTQTASTPNTELYDDSGTVGSNNATLTSTGMNKITLGRLGDSTPTGEYAGQIDEFRVIESALSADQITTEYNNQSDNATFFTSANPVGGGLSLNLAAGSFAVSGGVLNTLVSRSLALSGGVFSATGGDVTFQRGRTINLLGGSYSVTGGDVNLLANRALALNAGGFTLNGGDLDLVTARQLALASGTYSVTGGDLSLVYTPNTGAFELALEGGSFSITGGALDLLNSRLLALGVGEFGVTGGELGLVNGYVLDVDSGTFLLTGQTLDLDRTRAITLEQGDIIITGGSLDISFSGDTSSTIVMPHQIGDERIRLADVAEGQLAFNLTTGKMWTVDHLLNINTVGGLYNGRDLPKSDPQVAGAWWNDDGTLKVSEG